MAKKAGKAITGTEQVADNIRRQKPPFIQIVLIASDVSEGTRKRIVNCCKYYSTAYGAAGMTKEELGHTVGKSGAVSAVGITDKSFTAAVIQIINSEESTSMENSFSCKADLSAGGAIYDIKSKI